MRKAVLTPNPAPQAKQVLIIAGLPEITSGIITRDSVEIAIDTADRPDGTKVPIGRTNPGEFKISIDLADFTVRTKFEDWADMCLDQSRYAKIDGINGINPGYKRQATLVYYRLYTTEKPEDMPIVYKLTGCFITSRTLPDYQMSGTEMSTLELNCSYDDIQRGTYADAANTIIGTVNA